jgi:hypothetical protein
MFHFISGVDATDIAVKWEVEHATCHREVSKPCLHLVGDENRCNISHLYEPPFFRSVENSCPRKE